MTVEDLIAELEDCDDQSAECLLVVGNKKVEIEGVFLDAENVEIVAKSE